MVHWRGAMGILEVITCGENKYTHISPRNSTCDQRSYQSHQCSKRVDVGCPPASCANESTDPSNTRSITSIDLGSHETTRVPVVIQPSHGRYGQFSGLAPYSHVEFSAVAIRDHTSESRLVAMQTMGGAVRYIYPQREGFVPGHDAVTDAFFSLVVLDIEIERHSVVCSAAHDRRGAPALT
ncbi:hypothetical protein AB1N83_013539 [Pleurotus pulmonarius]